MVWFRFTEEFNFSPADKPAITVSYPAGREYNVTRECAEKALAKGRGHYVADQPAEAPAPAEELAEVTEFTDEELDEQDELEEILETEFADHGN